MNINLSILKLSYFFDIKYRVPLGRRFPWVAWADVTDVTEMLEEPTPLIADHFFYKKRI